MLTIFSNGHRQDQQSHYNEYNRRQPRRVARHSVPNLFQCQTAVPVYFLSQDYAADNFIQPLASAPAAPPFVYPNVLMTTYPDMGYANAQFLNEYGQQNMFQYRAPFVQVPVMSQNSPFINTTIPTTIPETVSEQNQADLQNHVSNEQSLDEELSQLLRRVFIDETEKSLRDLTDNLNIISQLNYSDRCLILRCQM